MKSSIFNGLLMLSAVTSCYLPIRALPSRAVSPPAIAALRYQPVRLAAVAGPLQLAGAWEISVDERRFGGMSALIIDRGRFLAVSDRGSVSRFDRPGTSNPEAWIADLRNGPGPWGKKWTRDAESLAADPDGRGWWVGFEQNHSAWLYGEGFDQALARIDLMRPDWWHNRGAEGLLIDQGELLVIGENGRDAMRLRRDGSERIALNAAADVAEATTAPDGSRWLLLRQKSAQGISQWIAPFWEERSGFRTGPRLPLPKAAFDNYEGMAIESRPGGGWRFWLISDDGHRIMARTLLVALDYVPSSGDDNSPATQAGP